MKLVSVASSLRLPALLALAAFAAAPARTETVWYDYQYFGPTTGDSLLLQFNITNPDNKKLVDGRSLSFGSYTAASSASPNGGLYIYNGTLTNAGTFTDTMNLSIGCNNGTFVNTGTFVRTGPADGVTNFYWGGTVVKNVVNSGTFEARSGRIEFWSGACDFNEGSTFTGAGLVRICAGYPTFTGNFYSDNLQLAGAANSYRGIGAVGHGSWEWLNSTLTGTWSNAGVLTYHGGGGKSLDYGTVFTNQAGGTVRWAADIFAFSGDSHFVNRGTVTATSDNTMGWYAGGGGRPTFENSGVFEKTGGTGQTRIEAVRFDNLEGGTVRVRSGELIINEAVTNAGTIDVGGGTSFRADAGLINTGSLVGTGTVYAPTLTNEGTIAPGYSPGTLTVVGNVTLGADSILNLEFGGPGASDLFLVTGEGDYGNLALGGTLNLICGSGYTPTLGDNLQLVGARSITGSFARTLFTGFGSGVTFGLSQDSSGYFATITAIPEPSTYAAIFGGLTLGLVAWRRWRARR